MEFAKLLGRAAMAPFSKALPPMGETERAAPEAGTVGFEGRIFAGQPDFDALLKTGPNLLIAQEQAFLGNEAPTLCAMLDNFAIDQAHDVPPEVWQFLREKRFFGIIIPRQWGGPGFGLHAHGVAAGAPGRLPGALVLSRTAQLAPLRDVPLLALAQLLRIRPDIVARLCPDVSTPKSGGLLDLMQARELSR